MSKATADRTPGEYVSEVIPFGHHGYVSYQIRMRHTEHGWYFRHEWRNESGEIDLDKWIPTKVGPNQYMTLVA